MPEPQSKTSVSPPLRCSEIKSFADADRASKWVYRCGRKPSVGRALPEGKIILRALTNVPHVVREQGFVGFSQANRPETSRLRH
jgi:hypothetical protein